MNQLDPSSARYYYADPRAEMRQFLPQCLQRVLEVGCGTGAFCSRIEDASEVWGVEPVEAAAAEASLRLTRVLHGVYDAVASALPLGYFDVVICNDVIEHMDDHDSFLDSIRAKLRPGGWLIGSIPNVRYCKVLFDLLAHREWRYADDGVLDRTHLRFFTDRSLARTLSTHGFDVEILKGINSIVPRVHGAKDMCKSLLFGAVALVSFGGLSDIRYRQFGFRARKSC